MIKVKGQTDTDMFITGHIIDPSALNVEFKNITFDCKTIKDASGHIFVRQKAGEWTNAGVLTVHCSNCKSEFHELEAMNFCPNCGAKMERRENDGR